MIGGYRTYVGGPDDGLVVDEGTPWNYGKPVRNGYTAADVRIPPDGDELHFAIPNDGSHIQKMGAQCTLSDLMLRVGYADEGDRQMHKLNATVDRMIDGLTVLPGTDITWSEYHPMQGHTATIRSVYVLTPAPVPANA